MLFIRSSVFVCVQRTASALQVLQFLVQSPVRMTCPHLLSVPLIAWNATDCLVPRKGHAFGCFLLRFLLDLLQVRDLLCNLPELILHMLQLNLRILKVVDVYWLSLILNSEDRAEF